MKIWKVQDSFKINIKGKEIKVLVTNHHMLNKNNIKKLQ